MVHGANGIQKHYGFEKIIPQVGFNPAMIVQLSIQVMSFVSGTYYLHAINDNMKAINDKLSDIKRIRTNEQIGQIESANRSLSRISSRKYIDNIDFVEIRNHKVTLEQIYLENKSSINEIINRDSLDPNKLNFKKKYIVEKFRDIHDKLALSVEANKSFLLAEIAEIGIRMKNNDSLEMINEMIVQLESDYNESLYNNLEKEIDSICNFLLKRLINQS